MDSEPSSIANPANSPDELLPAAALPGPSGSGSGRTASDTLQLPFGWPLELEPGWRTLPQTAKLRTMHKKWPQARFQARADEAPTKHGVWRLR